MRRVFLFTLFILLLLPSADMVTTDSFVEWEIINSGPKTLTNLPFVHYPNGNLAGYSEQNTFVFNSSLQYDSNRVFVNHRYYHYNETFSFYAEGLLNIVTQQAFYNPLKNDTYLVGDDFIVWKYNDTFYINQTWWGGNEGMGVVWYNLTNIYNNEYFYKPIARSGTKMVYDYENNFILFYGGSQGGSYHADTWIFDIYLGEWRQIMPLFQPGRRAYHGLTYNENDGKIYLFGGRDDHGPYEDLWVFDFSSNSWTEISMNNSPGRRSGHGMIYDSYNNKLLIYRGTLDDLWAYDFKSKYWTFLSAETGPTSGYEVLSDWIMYGNSSIIISGVYFYKLHLEMDSSPPGTKIIVTHTETVTTATTSTDTDYITVTDKTTETNYEDITRYQNLTSLLDGRTEETPFYTLGVFSMILAVIVIQRRRK